MKYFHFSRRTRRERAGNAVRRSTVCIVSTVMFLFGIVQWSPVPHAQIGPGNIEFLNPSSFSSAGEAGIIVSDKQTSRPAEGNATYRISAWTSNAPSNSGVEFELLQEGESLETFDGVRRVGPDTYEFDWDIPNSLPEGTYTLRASLFASNVAIDSVDQVVTVNRVAETADLTYPNHGNEESPFPQDGRFGTYTPLAATLPAEGGASRGLPVGNLDANHSGESEGAGTARVRAFYTTSPPGTIPEWQVCGTEAAPGDPTLSTAANNGIRCTLAGQSEQGAVTAVAVVPNTARGGFEARLNGSGDATRVVESYAQALTDFQFLAGGVGEVQDGESPDGNYACHTVELGLFDQHRREIIAANVDVHAWGPGDRLRFDTGVLSTANQAPDQSNHALEAGYDCFATNDEVVENQGEHQILGGPDVKHIETAAAGTSDAGIWDYSFTVPVAAAANDHTSQYIVWVDESDDGSELNNDSYSPDELVLCGSVGFGEAPAPPTGNNLLDVVICPGQPNPPPPETPGEDPEPEERSISLKRNRRQIESGQRVRLFGRIAAETERCGPGMRVKIKARREGGSKFRVVAVTTTDEDSRYSVRRRQTRTQQYRAIAPANEFCRKAKSRDRKVVVR